MMRSTFCCFSGISTEGEQRLWERGIESWSHVRHGRSIFSKPKWNLLRMEIDLAEQALFAGSADFFLNRLRGVHKTRVYPEFQERIAFLDIETDGLEHDSSVTTIALYHYGKLLFFVKGRNLDDFVAASARCGIWVTFNGTRFDLPILRRTFGLDLAQPHLDLMHVLRSMGVRGGLKACERMLGYERYYSVGMTGIDAINLWQKYIDHKDEHALKKLAIYNCEDVLALEWLLIRAYNESVSGFPHNVRCQLPGQDYVKRIFRKFLEPFAL